MSKIYVDCGQGYEPGWVNIDGMGTETQIGVSKRGAILYDAYKLPRDGQAELIKVKRVLERLNDAQLPEFLADCEQSLQTGGFLVLCIIDHDPATELARQYPHMNKIMFGPHPSYTWHVRKWTVEELAKEVEKYGLEFVDSHKDSSEYPCFWMKFVKPVSGPPAKDYAVSAELMSRLRTMKFLEVGPGRYPMPGAHTYVDIEQKFLDGLSGRTFIANLEEKLPFEDKEFDFVYCSHVLEHIENIWTAVDELSRVAKEGLIILPSIYKEFLFGYEEEDHVWEAIPNSQSSSELLLKHKSEEFAAIFNKDYQSSLCHLFRDGRYDSHERQVLRKWFRQNEAKLDVIVSWEGSFSVRVI